MFLTFSPLDGKKVLIKNRSMKINVTILMMFCITLATAQNPYTQKSNNLKIKQRAKQLSKQYDRELGMTEDQLLRFEIKVEEHLINETKIRKSNQAVENKILALKNNLNKETLSMGDILTRTQYQRYKEIKSRYQSIDSIVVGNVKSNKN